MAPDGEGTRMSEGMFGTVSSQEFIPKGEVLGRLVEGLVSVDLIQRNM